MLSVPLSDARPVRPPPSGALPELPDQVAALQTAIRALIAHVLREHRNHPDVDDATSEVLRRALEGQERLRTGEPLRPWVLGIARHVALDALRQRSRAAARRASDGSSPDGNGGAAVDRLVAPDPGPEAQAALRERAQRMRTAMSSLAPEQRKALLLFHVEGLAYREIAERLSVPLGTVGTWVMRGRQSLASALSEEAPS